MPRGVTRYDEARLQGRLWTPATLAPSLVCWYDADDLSTITVSTGVSEWRDKSGNGRNVSQATGSQQPTLNLNNFNARNSIRFTRSSSQRLDATNFPTSGISDLAVYIVTRWQTTGPTTNDIQGLIDNNHSASANWVIQDRPDLTNKPLTAAHIPATGNGAVDTVQTGDDTWKLIGGVFDGGTNGSDTLFVNGTQKATVTNTSNLTTNATLRIGGTVVASNRFFNGSHAEIVLTQDISAIVRQRIEGYLAWKWGLASSLDASHPFYNRPPLIGAI